MRGWIGWRSAVAASLLAVGSGEVTAQRWANGGGVGVGVGVGRPWGYGWGGYPGFGFFPGAYNGFYSNGFSLYGPPIRTDAPVPGVFGGGDQRHYGLAPGYPLWYPWGGVGVVVPLRPAQPWTNPLVTPFDVTFPEPSELPTPRPLPANLADEAPRYTVASASGGTVRVRVPDAGADVWFNGQLNREPALVRAYRTPALLPGEGRTVTITARFRVAGQVVSRAQTVTVASGATVLVDFGTND
jgi:uncharacterized protein (TIGR03000 family)